MYIGEARPAHFNRYGSVAELLRWYRHQEMQFRISFVMCALGLCASGLMLAIGVSHGSNMVPSKWKNRVPAVVKDGYQDKLSYFPGDRATVYLNTETVGATKIRLLNMNRVAVDSILFMGIAQKPANDSAYYKGFGYAPTFVYRIPKRLKSGVYHWEGSNVHFIVKSLKEQVEFVVVYPTNTEQAYNELGGKSLYDHNSGKSGRAHTVSFLRPINYQAAANINNRDYVDGFLRWLEKSDHDYGMVSDMDVDDRSTLNKGRVVVVIGHSEYWTRAARENFDWFVDGGRNAIVLSGNTMWWQVRYSPDRTQLICYKDTLKDPVADRRLLTTYWYEPVLGMPTLNSLGAHFLLGGYGYKHDPGWDGYKVSAAASPILKGTGLKRGEVVECANKEIDGTALRRVGLDRYGYPMVDSMALGFYKIEVVGFDLGYADKRWPSHAVATFVACQRTAESGRIINVAGTDWCAPLTFEGKDGGKVQMITENMFDLQLGNENIFSPHVRPWSGSLPRISN